MKLLTAIYGLSCLLVGLSAADPAYTGLALSHEVAELTAKQSFANWVDTSDPQKHCGTSGGLNVVHSDGVSDFDWTRLLDDCQGLLNASNSRNGYSNITFSGLLNLASYGSCMLTVRWDNDSLPLGIMRTMGNTPMGNSDISGILESSLDFMKKQAHGVTFKNLSGTIDCDLLTEMSTPSDPNPFIQVTWYLTLEESASTGHQASLSKRQTNFTWEATPKAPGSMCGNSTKGTMVQGHGTSNFSTVLSDCLDLQAAYNSSNDGYYNISIDPEGRSFFIMLDARGICSLSVIAPSNTTEVGSVSFQ